MEVGGEGDFIYLSLYTVTTRMIPAQREREKDVHQLIHHPINNQKARS